MSPCLFNLYAKYIMRNAGLEEAQARIKSLLMKVKEESEKVGLKHNIHGCMRQVLRAGALGRPKGMGWGGRWEGGSGWGTRINPWLIHVNVWQ